MAISLLKFFANPVITVLRMLKNLNYCLNARLGQLQGILVFIDFSLIFFKYCNLWWNEWRNKQAYAFIVTS